MYNIIHETDGVLRNDSHFVQNIIPTEFLDLVFKLDITALASFRKWKIQGVLWEVLFLFEKTFVRRRTRVNFSSKNNASGVYEKFIWFVKRKEGKKSKGE